jgi:tRNA A-37 threonylcarbamoyl transferase component Bud32
MKMKPCLILSFLIIFPILMPAQTSKVNIIIKTNVPGASVTIDNQLKGKTNNSGQIIISNIDIGRHQVKISGQGYEEITQTIDVDTLNVMFNIELQELKEKPIEKPIESKPVTKPEQSKPISTGSTYLMINCNIGSANVYVDGAFIGKTDSTSGNFYLKTKPGKIDLKLEKEGYKTFSKTIDAGLGGNISVPLIKEKEETNILLFVFIAVIGVTVLVLIFILVRVLSGARAMGRFGDYQLLKPIGKGGMAAIYKARWMKTNQLVALKVMDAGLMHDKELVLKFFSEGKIVSEINKKFPDAPVIRVYEYGRDRVKTLGIPYIAMEFFEGTSLSQIITTNRIDLKEKIRIVMEVARALGAAHQLGIFHRDITPDNILIKGKHVRLIDFGIAEESFNPNNEITDSVTGKPIYMSPEQCAAKGVNGKSDIYSLGVILYFWITGHPPFYAKNHLEVMRMHQEVPVPPLDREIPANLDGLITAMLDKNPALRPSADELYEALKKIIE